MFGRFTTLFPVVWLGLTLKVTFRGEEFVVVEPSDTRIDSSHSSSFSDFITPLSPDHPLTRTSPTPTPTRALFHDKTACMTVRVLPMMSPGLSANIAEAAAMSDLAFHKRFMSPYDSLLASTLSVWKRYKGTYELILDTDSDEDELGDKDTDVDEGDESLDLGDEREGLDDEDRSLDDEDREGSEEEAIPEGQQRATSVVERVMGEPLGLGYAALRRQKLAVEEDRIHNTFEVGQGSGSITERERPERASALRQPTITIWTDLEDGKSYIDIPTYPPPAPPVQTTPSPEWSSVLLPVSLAPYVVPSPIPSPIASPVAAPTSTIPLLDAVPPTLFTEIDRDVRELYTRALWRPVLALEAWAGHLDTRMVNLSRAGYDDHRLIYDVLLQQATLHRELREMRDHVTALEQERDRREG
nr:hypothetical protein [Tanacetum cinerariifolium]